MLAAIACVVALILLIMPAPEGVDPNVLRAAGIVTLAIGLWATALVPEYFTAIVFFFLAVVLGVAPPEVVFSGFHSGATWMVFGGLVIGIAIAETGLGTRIASAMMVRFGRSYFGVIVGTVLVGAVLSLLMPSSAGRVVVMLPIVLALADRMGFVPGTRGRTGITMATVGGTLYPSFGILPSSVPNLALMGAAESIHGIQFTYMQYLIAEYPVISVVGILALPPVVWLLFRDTPRPVDAVPQAGQTTAAQRRVLFILLVALALWMSDFAHGISPAWIGLGAAVLCLVPRFGALPPEDFLQRFSLGPWFFVAGIIGVGAVVNSSGLGEVMGRWLFSVVTLAPGEDARNFAALAAIGMAVGLFVAIPGQPVIMTAMAPSIADATGWPLITVLLALPMTWGMGLFAYQYPPMVLAMHLGGVRAGEIARLLAAMSLVTWIVILPLQFLWWQHLNMFG